MKFVLVVSNGSLTNNRMVDFIPIVDYFINVFNPQFLEKLDGCVTLVVTHAPNDSHPDNYKYMMEDLLEENENLNEN